LALTEATVPELTVTVSRKGCMPSARISTMCWPGATPLMRPGTLPAGAPSRKMGAPSASAAT
jgi:hypothetical protein